MTVSHSYDGNRLPVPAIVGSAHFCYLTDAPTLDPTDVKTVVETAKASKTLTPWGIEVLDHQSQLFKEDPQALEALQRLVRKVRCFLGGRRRKAELVVCQWTQLHVDHEFLGRAFYSIVLHTGPEPYLLYLLHTAPDKDGGSSVTHGGALVLDAEKAFVFDPTTPHQALPMRPHQDNLLILLQFQLVDETVEDREALLRRLVPDHAKRSEFVEDDDIPF